MESFEEQNTLGKEKKKRRNEWKNTEQQDQKLYKREER